MKIECSNKQWKMQSEKNKWIFNVIFCVAAVVNHGQPEPFLGSWTECKLTFEIRLFLLM